VSYRRQSTIDPVEAPAMRLPRVRLTVRRMMAGVAIVVLSTWLSTTAVRVRNDQAHGGLLHMQADDNASSGFSFVWHHAPFWPRYWRRVIGQAWPGSYTCPCEAWTDRPNRAVTVVGPWYRELGGRLNSPGLNSAENEALEALR
jgi:hypothetical protein